MRRRTRQSIKRIYYFFTFTSQNKRNKLVSCNFKIDRMTYDTRRVLMIDVDDDDDKAIYLVLVLIWGFC